MGRGVRLLEVFDIEIRLDYSWFLIFFLLSWSLAVGVFPAAYDFAPGMNWLLGFAGSVLLFTSVLLHEISHALMARRFGVEVHGITLFLFGGVAQIKSEPPSPGAEFWIAAVGPAVSILIGAGCLLGAWLAAMVEVLRPVAALLLYLGQINLILAVFNLIPGFPLDGGRILRAAVWRFTGSLQKATQWASIGGQLFAWFLIGIGAFQILFGGNFGGFWLILVGWFLNTAAQGAYQQLLLRRALSGVPVAEVMVHDVPMVDADMRVSQFVEHYLLRRDYSVYPIAREGEFVGVVGLEEVRRLQRDLWGVTGVGAIAREPSPDRMIAGDENAFDALSRMLETEAPRLLVMRDGHLEGIVSRDSILRRIQLRGRLGLPV